jgi:beta-N-acetylhexosaminidase
MRANSSPDLPSPSELFIVGYDGQSPPDGLRQRFAQGDYAGLIFFSRNFASPLDVGAVADLLDSLLNRYQPSPESTWTDPEESGDEQDEVAGQSLARLPPILSIDHEGGRVQRLKAPLTVWPPMAVLAAQPPRVAEEVGRAIASELQALGFNLNYAPVLDVHTNPDNPIIGDRAFGSTAKAASERAMAFLRGLEQSGCLRGCGKHFPGHGDTQTDSHHALPVVPHDEARLHAVELAPFAEAIRGGEDRAGTGQLGMIMTAHVVYPAIDRRPATLSRRWLTDILRGQLGFRGVILSDDLDMKALGGENLAAAGLTLRDEGDVVIESLLAGCDAFLLCRDPARQERAEEALRRAARDRPEVRARLIESVRRVRRFRATLSWPCPDRVALARLPNPQHQALRERLLLSLH